MGPRIRSIKPEISRSPDFVKLSNAGRVVFYALIGQADDAGRLQGFDAEHLATTYCAPGTSVHEVGEQLDLMEKLDMIRRYGGRSHVLFTQVLHFSAHQRIDKPKESLIPAPPNSKRRLPVGERSATRLTGSDQTGGDQIRPDRRGSVSPTAHSASAEQALVLRSEVSVSPVVQVFRAWATSTGRSGRTLLDDKRQRLIVRALAAYELEDVLDAVDGWRFDAHHRGENDRGRPYNDLGLILRDPEHIERFRDFKRRPVAVVMPTGKPSMSAFYRDQAAKHAEAGD